jgi:hypothetical protein
MKNKVINKTIIDFTALNAFIKALKVLDHYHKIKSNEIDLSKIFVKVPTQKKLKEMFKQVEHNNFGWMGVLLFVGEMWAEQHDLELTPEAKKFFKKFRKSVGV